MSWDPEGSGQLSNQVATGSATVHFDTTGARFPVDVATEMVDLAANAGGMPKSSSGA